MQQQQQQRADVAMGEKSLKLLATFLIIADLLQVIAAAAAATTSPVKCYDTALDYYPFFSTRTAYEKVHGHVRQINDNCTAAQVWMMNRHGTRYPGRKVIAAMHNLTALRDEILRNHERGAGFLCPRDLDMLRDWQLDPNLSAKKADVLVEQGERDLRQLAERLRDVFPHLLDGTSARPGDFVFRATDTQRTKASMRAFYRGLFGDDESVAQFVAPPVNDTLLMAQNFCPAWKNSYEIDRVSEERDKFTAGPEVRAVLEIVARRLGFSRDLEFATIKSMYDMCRFEAAWYPYRTSTWCTLFRPDELKVLEYREDLDFYYFAGPGRPMSAKLACQALSDMFEHFKSLASGNSKDHNQPRGVFYFAHTITLHTLMAALRINVEEPKPLLASNYAEVQDRRYRTSLFGPFATNVLAVLYRCGQSSSQYKVAIYTAERLVKLPGCEDGLCDWDFLERKYAPDVDQCSMDFCHENVPTDAATWLHSSQFIVLTMILALTLRFISST